MNPDIKENNLKVQKQKKEIHQKENCNQNSTGKNNQEIIDAYDYLSNAASAQDCTGLIPAKPQSKEELEAYEELYHFLPPYGHFH